MKNSNQVEINSIPEIEGAKLLFLGSYEDHRGQLQELFTKPILNEIGMRAPIHALISRSRANVLRGIHFQLPAQGKYVHLLEGSATFFGVDLRSGSPTYMERIQFLLSDKSHPVLWLPEGIGFGFHTHTPTTLVYFMTEARSADEFSISYKDPDIDFQTEGLNPMLSEKDAKAPLFKDLCAIGVLPFVYSRASSRL